MACSACIERGALPVVIVRANLARRMRRVDDSIEVRGSLKMAKTKVKKKTAATTKSRSAKSGSTRSRTAKAQSAKARSASKSSARKKTKASAPKRAIAAPARRKARVTKARVARAPAATASVAKRTLPPQRVAVSHYNNADFETGLRSYAQYRDLGIVEATNGLVRAHVLRFTEACDPAVVSKLHFHDTEFQMVYVLKGWVKTELEGEGEITMRAGSAWTQPPKIKHKINDYSEDAALLEITLPADFETEELAG
jgi:uncharacterized RmlC-like cupin family protein